MQGKSRVLAVFMILLNDKFLFSIITYYVFGETLINARIYRGKVVFMLLFWGVGNVGKM